MFCRNCGSENEENALVCVKCGNSLKKTQGAENTSVRTVKTGNRNRMVGIAVVAVAAAVIIGIVFGIGFSLFGGRGYKTTVKNFFEAIRNEDAEAVLELFPEEVQAEEDWEKDIRNNMDRFYTKVWDAADGDDWDFSFEIKDAEKVIGKELKETREFHEDYDVEVDEAMEVEVELKGKGGRDTMSVPLIKVGGDWYLDAHGM